MGKEFEVNSLDEMCDLMCNNSLTSNKHRDAKIDRYIGKRVSLTDFKGMTIRGLLTYDEAQDRYRMSNVIDKRGFPTGDWLFRKSHIKKIEV